jgi:hypothetical protein
MENKSNVQKMATRIKDKVKSRRKCKIPDDIKLTKYLVAVTIIVALTALLMIILFGISVNQKHILVPTTTSVTTTKGGNLTDLSIGQYCLYNNQCPQNAFCSGTCQCPLHYYYNTTIGVCIIRKTNAIACTADFECNINVGLRCSTTCECDSTRYFNSTFINGGGFPNGRCQNKKGFGMSCPASNEGTTGINYANYFGSQIRRCWCESGWDWYLNLNSGKCWYNYRMYEVPCFSNAECHQAYGMCMDKYNDGNKKCENIPTIQWYQTVRGKQDYGNTGCSSNAYVCNEWKNLKCRTNNNVATCLCFDENYYYNNTMCVFGRRYGSTCSSSAQCTPTTAALTCDLPYTGAIYTVCRCAIGTSYYDISTKTCLALKALNSTCRDSSECSGGATNSMFCGEWAGGSIQVCFCTDAYYPSGSTCVAKLVYNDVCSSSNQCLSHLNQTCLANNNKCGCASGKYFSSSDTTCKQLKYYRDSCSSGNECWSGTCTLSLCT